MLLAFRCSAQVEKIKSTAHGLNMMLGDVPKEALIEEMRFEHGKDSVINVVRFDHIGPSLYPLIISSKLPIATDSLGILSVVWQKDSLYDVLEMIDNVNPKIRTREFDKILIRVTYRFEGRSDQYYVTNPIAATKFLKMIERKFIDNKNLADLKTFYRFIGETNLQVFIHGERSWKY
jgi:hypothetical protein